MYTLTIAQIFSNLSFYQDHYLNILECPEQYYTQVEGAFIHVWPFKKQSLYLGDLLQLWFAEKWKVQPLLDFKIEEYLAAVDVQYFQNSNVYVYAIQGNALNGANTSHVWSLKDQRSHIVNLNLTLKSYCEFVACQRPRLVQPNYDAIAS